MLKLEGAQLNAVRWPVVAIDAVHGPMFAFFQFLLASALCLKPFFTVGRILNARDRTHQAQHCNHCDSRQNFLHYFLLGLYFEWHGAAGACLLRAELFLVSPAKLLFQRADVADQIFHLIRFSVLYAGILGGFPSEMILLNLRHSSSDVGSCHVGGLMASLPLPSAPWQPAHLALNVVFPSCRIGFRRRA